MANRCWVVQNAMAGVRNDLYELPRSLNDKCFYDNPLKNLARAGTLAHHSDLCLDEPRGMWNSLTNFRSTEFFVELEQYYPDRLRLMALWEWLWSLRDGNGNRRLAHFERPYQKLDQKLMQGYVLFMRRALEAASLHAETIPERCFPWLRIIEKGAADGVALQPVTCARTAGADYFAFCGVHESRKPTIQILDAPLHVALLINRKAAAAKKTHDVDRGRQFRENVKERLEAAKENDDAPARVDTPMGFYLKDLPKGCKGGVGVNDGWGSVTSSFLVAMAIENWLDEHDDKAAMLNAAMGRSA
jgi:hypothetical protein